MQSFFESTIGKVSVIAVIVLLLLLIFLPNRKYSESTKPDIKALTISALLIALAMILSQIKVYSMPQGGSVTLFSLLPIALCSYLLGPKKGIMAGIALGLVNLIFGPYVIHPAQLLLDYPLAFGAMGVGGIFRNTKNGLTVSYLLGQVFLCCFIRSYLLRILRTGRIQCINLVIMVQHYVYCR